MSSKLGSSKLGFVGSGVKHSEALACSCHQCFTEVLAMTFSGLASIESLLAHVGTPPCIRSGTHLGRSMNASISR